ncbi:YesL family protein [Shouchella clausii]|uniref:YesL family protein n=1 Tax=Shouchella clausii TaxID=79880 RepID=UPI00280B4DD3|nr:DUF624 domain-containing protein [Shouchella clausii]WMM33137.1 DUF624 domain-containing protein [Shouchella clausii]
MEDKKEYGQGILFTVTNYIYWFLLTNIYFILMNSVFLFFFMTLQPSFSNILLYFLALIPSGPAIAAMCYSMEKLVRTKELSPTRDFFEGYKKNLKDTFSIWLPMLVICFILLVDFHYFRQSPSHISQIGSVILVVLLIMWTMVMLNVLVINARYKFRVRDLFRLSIYYGFTKVKQTTGNLLILFIVGVITASTTNFFILFTGSVIVFLIVLNMKAVFADIEDHFLVTPSKGKQSRA